MQGTLQGKRICLFAEAMFEDLELLYPLHRLAEEGAEVVVVGTGKDRYHGKHGFDITPDTDADTAMEHEFDAVVIPGGYAPDKLRTHGEVLEIVRRHNDAGKPIAIICHAAWVAISAGIVEGRRMTCFWSLKDDLINAGGLYVDEPVVVDGNLITSRHPPDLGAFCRALIDALAGHVDPPTGRSDFVGRPDGTVEATPHEVPPTAA